MEALALPEEVNKVVMKDVQRLRRMQPAQPEYNVILSYLEFVLTLPWHDEHMGQATEDTEAEAENESPEPTDAAAAAAGDGPEDSVSFVDEIKMADAEIDEESAKDANGRGQSEIDLAFARRVLDEDHCGLEVVKKRMLQYLAVCSLREDLAGPILCLVGPPGVGKTSLGHSIATALHRKFHRLCLGGVRDEAEIRGHRRTYIGALPGQVLQAFARSGTRRPVILLDEIDKLSRDSRGDPAAALLEVRVVGYYDLRSCGWWRDCCDVRCCTLRSLTQTYGCVSAGIGPSPERNIQGPLSSGSFRHLQSTFHCNCQRLVHDPTPTFGPHGSDSNPLLLA